MSYRANTQEQGGVGVGIPVRCWTVPFEAEADGSIGPSALIDGSGRVEAYAVIFDSPTPNNLSVSISDRDNIAIVPTEIFTSSARVAIAPAQPFIGGFTLSLTGNTVAWAKGKIIVYST